MEVTNEAAAMLCNHEVYTFLKDIEAGRYQRKPDKYQGSLGTVLYETVKYLETTPCRLQDPESVEAFLLALRPFKLTKAEKLQLLNQCPTTPVEVLLIVEESEERLTERQIQEILDIVAQHFPLPSAEVPENDSGDQEEEEDDEDEEEEEGEAEEDAS